MCDFFLKYVDEFLDPHFDYFSQFLTALLHFKQRVNAKGWQKV